jgi:hypothetical protein
MENYKNVNENNDSDHFNRSEDEDLDTFDNIERVFIQGRHSIDPEQRLIHVNLRVIMPDVQKKSHGGRAV